MSAVVCHRYSAPLSILDVALAAGHYFSVNAPMITFAGPRSRGSGAAGAAESEPLKGTGGEAFIEALCSEGEP